MNIQTFEKGQFSDMKKFLLLVFLTISSMACLAQSDRQYIRDGNRLYRQQNFVKAEAEYRKALAVNPSNPQALYNLGCALMMQKKDSVATKQFEAAGRLETSPMRKAKVYHNIGFICQSHKLYGEAIEAYKESLRNNPSDDETRYNLALCKRLQKNEKNNKQQKQQNNKDKNKGKDKKQQDKNQQKKQQDKNQQQNQQDKMSKDNAEQLLNAAMQQEQATRQRIKDAMRQNRSRRLQKNW